MSWLNLLNAEIISMLSATATVVTFFTVLIYSRVNSIKVDLHELIKRALSASALPTAIVILICTIDLSLLEKLAGVLRVYIALAGLCLAYVSAITLFSPMTSKPPD